jgi:hypothetical protein
MKMIPQLHVNTVGNNSFSLPLRCVRMNRTASHWGIRTYMIIPTVDLKSELQSGITAVTVCACVGVQMCGYRSVVRSVAFVRIPSLIIELFEEAASDVSIK